MKTIKKVSSKSVAKMLGAMYAFFGFIFGLIVMVFSLATNTEGGAVLGFGVASPIILLFIYGVLGWIGGYIGGGVYNVLAKHVGGVQVEVE